MAKVSKDKITEVDINEIDINPTDYRLDISDEKIDELAKSISEVGLLQPILLRPKNGRFEIVAGKRRYLAHKKIELQEVRAIIKELSDEAAALARATENLARVDLTPMEEATTYRDLVVNHKMSYEQVAKKMGKTPGTIKRRMDLLKMPPQLQEAVHSGKLSMSAAEELWPIANETDLEYYLLFAIENGCTKEVAREWCKQWKDSQRRLETPGDMGGQSGSPQAPRPYYVACDICDGPEELNNMVRLGICPTCHKTIKENM